ncbi:D-alanyl-D-alanine carboxypeptidase family protein [Streptomyces sp. NPDC058374]|uniref:D-alanyl-D-alanine carboxypeptidase family protein n=1 Tax=unclassified Streptomyces TaxID=2593676 RepID=UPI003667D344
MPALRKTTVLVASTALMTLSAAFPAVAADQPDDDKARPPGKMSQIGGARLGQAGTQVNAGPGVPKLPKKLTGRSWIVADAESGDVLASHNAHWKLPPASTLKMLFADTVLPKLPKDEKHLVTDEELADVGAGSSLVGVKEDQTYTVHDLWLGVFLSSGNDAVHVLSAMNDGVKKTVADMNAHAKELQALDTHVVSPDGYDAKGQLSSAYDLTLIARSGMQKKDFREYCSTVSAQFPGEKKKGEKREHFGIQNTNRLLTGAMGLDRYEGIAGVKNGNTTKAGATFTGVAERDGRVLLVTVMNPDSRESQAVYQETARLFDWGFKAADKADPVGTLVPPVSAEAAVGKETPEGAAGGAPAPAAGGEAQAAASAGSTGVGTALAVAGGSLLLLGAGVYVINRRRPLPGRGTGRRRR